MRSIAKKAKGQVGAWELLDARLQVARHGHGGAVGGLLFAIAGAGGGAALTSVETLDPLAATTELDWKAGVDLTYKREYTGAGSIPAARGSYALLVVGGQSADYNDGVPFVEWSVGGAWSSVRDLMPRTRIAACSIPGTGLLVSGGLRGGTALKTADLWTMAPNRGPGPRLAPKRVPQSDMGIGRFHHATTVDAQGRAWVLGGSDDDSRPISSVEIFDVEKNTWMGGADLPSPRNYFAAACDLEGRVYAIGGTDGKGRLDSVVIWDPKTRRWEDGPPLTFPRSFHAAVLGSDGAIYVFGGDADEGADASRVDRLIT